MPGWLRKVWIKPIRIYLRPSWEKGQNERFKSTLRREILNAEWFHTTKKAQIAINIWLKQYNSVRPHQALIMGPPIPEPLHESGP